MTKSQIITIAGFSALFLILLFGFRTKPKELLEQERTRSLNLSATDISIIRDEAMQAVDGSTRSNIQILQSQLENNQDSIAEIEILKNLSSTWYNQDQYAMAGHYAEQIGQVTESAQAWGIAGTTYAIGIKRSTEDKQKLYCKEKALESLENAISLDPDNLDYQINRAVIFAEHPDSENPMRGIQILLKLNKNFPKNVPVINNLAKFALQTNQLDKASERLQSALALEPNNKTTVCLMAEAMSRQGQMAQAEEFRIKCEQLK